MIPVPATTALALRLCRRSPGSPDDLTRRLLIDPGACTAFHRWAMDQGVLGLVLRALQGGGWLEGLEPAVRSRILAPLRVLRPQATLWDIERNRVLAVLHGVGITPVVLKGAALRALAYGEAVERPMGDLDLLVRQSEMERATAALCASGYRAPAAEAAAMWEAEHFHLPLTNPAGFEVELHWGLGQPSVPWRLDAAGMIARAVPIPSAHGTMLVPSVEDMIVHLCTQNTEDNFSKLRRFVDIDRLAAAHPPDWGRIEALALESGTEAIVGLSLSLTSRFLGTPIPGGLPRSLIRSRPARFHLRALAPEAALLAGTGQKLEAGSLALSLWLATPTRRMSQLRNILLRQDQMGYEAGVARWRKALTGMDIAVKLFGFHLVLWARGLQTMTFRSPAEGPGLWDNISDQPKTTVPEGSDG